MHRKFFKRKFFILSVLVCICMTIMQSAGAENLKAEELKDGTYTVNIALWHQFMDKPSMGNKGIIPEAELEVKDGKATMFIETQIIQVTGITASVVSFFNFNEEKQDFTKAEAHAYNFEIDGQKRPKIFLFPIKPGSEYYRCMVDPKVEVMGDKPIEARLKVDWSSLKLVEKSLKQEIIDENAESDILAKLELQKQEQEALANSDGTVKEKHEILPVVPVESGASMSEIGTGIIGRPGPSLLYATFLPLRTKAAIRCIHGIRRATIRLCSTVIRYSKPKSPPRLTNSFCSDIYLHKLPYLKSIRLRCWKR